MHSSFVGVVYSYLFLLSHSILGHIHGFWSFATYSLSYCPAASSLFDFTAWKDIGNFCFVYVIYISLCVVVFYPIQFIGFVVTFCFVLHVFHLVLLVTYIVHLVLLSHL